MNSKQVVRMGFVLGVVFSLAGCGGGSSSGGGGGISFDTDDIIFTERSRVAAGRAATATPKAGSVTQSSNVDASDVTEDQVEATVNYDDGTLGIEVTFQGSSNVGRVSSTEHILIDDESPTARVFGKFLDDGSAVAVYVDTDRESAVDTDYLALGFWVQIPASASTVTELEIGAFANNGGDLVLTGRDYLYSSTPTNATYDGSAIGLQLGDDGEYEFFQAFEADVDLIAEFDDSPTIRGEVSFDDIDVDDDTQTTAVLTLESADIGNLNGGFFTGVTSATIDTDGGQIDLTGKWGGQFYGAEAKYAVGTFGAQFNSDDFDAAFVGAFATEKE